MRRATAFFLCLCLAASGGLALAACGDSSSSSSSSSKKKKKKSSTTSTTTTGGPGVGMLNIQFDPKAVSVKAGNTVTWTNNESVQHDVTADDGSFKSGPGGGMKQGDKYEYTFDKAGNFAYKCTVHPNMTGTVDVTQ